MALFVVPLLFGTLLASTVTAALVRWWYEEPATLASIAVQGTNRLTSADVASATGLARGSRLDEVSESELVRSLTDHPWIQEARVASLPTGTLIIDVTEREARAVLRDDSGVHFVDEEGIAFAVVQPEDEQAATRLPLIVGNDSVATALRHGLTISARLADLTLPSFAQDGAPHRGLSLQLPSADEARKGWVLRGERGPEVILGSDDEAVVAGRLDRLERLLEADLDELEGVTAIDLRFAGQAVLRKTSTSK